MPKAKKGYDFDGVVIRDSIDAYVDSAGIMKVVIDDRLEKLPMDRRKKFDKKLLDYLKRLDETIKILENISPRDRGSRNYVYLARELSIGYINALKTASSYNGKENGRDFSNIWG